MFEMFMISVLPQTEHLHRKANGLTAETQLQLVAGCFIGGALLVGPGLDLTRRRPRESPSWLLPVKSALFEGVVVDPTLPFDLGNGLQLVGVPLRVSLNL